MTTTRLYDVDVDGTVRRRDFTTTTPVSRIEVALECDARARVVIRAIAIGENPAWAASRGGREARRFDPAFCS